jgi:outer membrane protein
MILRKILLAIVFPVIAMGCATVLDARKMQAALSPKGEDCGNYSNRARVNLIGEDLPSLVAFAQTNRPSIVSYTLEVEDARLALKQIDADAPIVSRTPLGAFDLSLSGGHSELSAGSKFEDLKLDTDGGASAGLSLDVLVYDFGRNSARAKAAAENLVSSELSLLNAGYDVFGEVASAYFTVLEKDALLEVAYTNEYECALQLEQSEALFESGEGQQLDVLRSRLDLAEAKEATVIASNNVATAGAELVRALGLDASFASREDIVAYSGMNKSVETIFAQTDKGAGELFEFARTNAPTMKIARAKLRAASSEVDYAIAELYPNVNASLSLNWTDPLWYWRWGLNAAQSLFAGFKKTTAVDRAVLKLENASANIDAEEQNLSAAISKAVAVRDNAYKSYVTSRDALERARENLDMVREQYKIGDASRVDYTTAVSDYTLALANRVRAVYTSQIAEASLFKLLGLKPIYAKGEFLEELK